MLNEAKLQDIKAINEYNPILKDFQPFYKSLLGNIIIAFTLPFLLHSALVRIGYSIHFWYVLVFCLAIALVRATNTYWHNLVDVLPNIRMLIEEGKTVEAVLVDQEHEFIGGDSGRTIYHYKYSFEIPNKKDISEPGILYAFRMTLSDYANFSKNRINIRYLEGTPCIFVFENELQDFRRRKMIFYPSLVVNQPLMVAKPLLEIVTLLLTFIITVAGPLAAILGAIETVTTNIAGITLNAVASIFLAPELLGIARLKAIETLLKTRSDNLLGWLKSLSRVWKATFYIFLIALLLLNSMVAISGVLQLIVGYFIVFFVAAYSLLLFARTLLGALLYQLERGEEIKSLLTWLGVICFISGNVLQVIAVLKT